MKLYNSLTRKVESINIHDNTVNIYSCGPTVYNYIHLGNARPSITMDFVVRYLQHKGIKVNYLQNITDVDDKIINKAIEENKLEKEVSEFYSKQYFADLKALNVLEPTKVMKISDYIPEMVKFIQKMIDNGSAYESDGDVFFDIEKYKEQYGKLSGRKIDELIVGSRVEENEKKRNPLDFALWKKTDKGIKWNTPFGEGRPGWHTECAVLNDLYFNHETIDIHGGGIDLKFPHHENERIQYIAVNEKELAHTWAHNGHLTFNNEKMSKSLGNVVMVKDFLKNNDPDLLRWLFMTTPWTQPLDLNDEILGQGVKFLNKLENINKKSKAVYASGELKVNLDKDTGQAFVDDFDQFMEDNLNTTNVLALIDAAIKEVNKDLLNNELTHNYQELKDMIEILGFNFKFDYKVDEADTKKYKEWQQLVKDKNYDEADKLRAELVEKGLM